MGNKVTAVAAMVTLGWFVVKNVKKDFRDQANVLLPFHVAGWE